MLKYKGYPIFPRDLEEILLSHPLVKEAFVYGEDSGNLGTQPVAKVLVKEKKKALKTNCLIMLTRESHFIRG